MNEVLTYEALKAERDAQQKRADALAVENVALKSKAAELVHEASEVYSAYNATIREPDGDFMDMQTLHEMQCIETPATDAAIAAIEARGVERFVTLIAERLRTAGGEDGYSLVNYGEYADHLEAKGEEYATELREAK